MGQGSGRDHHILSFALWMAGGGIKGGLTYGATDDLGYRAVENVVQVRDLQVYVQKMSGAKLPIVSDDQNPQGTLILVRDNTLHLRAEVFKDVGKIPDCPTPVV